mmetsp:Transcript_10451/g.23100  ORF Transcript_10451/g.23100 Transcript_10451/m.23100 type:complete len:178 (+) Transcript_10451:379-912(+)|eukprot:CAMPEP_0113331112 /NCGR_PEP_ID=MMETSP0010_2-20120614/22267_1 /TAXON_ID=216773 ORGANISM="Corethron hystrix, Strain 308" /NCGR_SAMPLE_ID=MMETSP0010_2 /ASSEMBLY_ACC=CAM_ASM_000155 /LENGTH=177 /DNA_ID=CAMNT_0000194261 /DNA_START=276 /DNA_END=809 /DNA_ORIENTATION=- /assembly_acc=CAM_ASM_000155
MPCEKCDMPLVRSCSNHEIHCVVCPILIKEALIQKIDNLEKVFVKIQEGQKNLSGMVHSSVPPTNIHPVNKFDSSKSDHLPGELRSPVYDINSEWSHQSPMIPQNVSDCGSVVSLLDDTVDERSSVASSTLEIILTRIEDLTVEITSETDVDRKIKLAKLVDGLAKAASAFSGFELQ